MALRNHGYWHGVCQSLDVSPRLAADDGVHPQEFPMRSFVTCLSIASLCLGLAACGDDNKGPMEKTGESIDKAAEKTGEVLKDGAQKTGEAIEKAGEKVQEAVK